MSNKTYNSLNPLKIYISALIENIDKEKIPKNIDLILDGGLFNGAFEYGILLYLKELEKIDLLNIDRISGCSIGSIIGLLYLTGSIDENIHIYEEMITAIRETLFLDKISSIIHDIVNKYVTNIERLNNKLYITYYDITTMQQIVCSTFKNKEELIQILIRSTYIPYITDGKIQYDDRYIDGCSPFIFQKTEKKALFIYLSTFKNIKSMVYIKNEVNIWPRLMSGVIDVNNFFSGSNSSFCSYVNNWNITDFTLIQIREILIFCILILIKLSLFAKEIIPKNMKENIYINRFQDIFLAFYKNLFSYLVL
mgnify:CR=1 FL=1|jgi:hypothetical protein